MRKFNGLSVRAQKTLIIILVIIVCLDAAVIAFGGPIMYFRLAFNRMYNPDIIISAPDGRHELVVCEWGFGMGGGAEIYIREPGQDRWKMQFIGEISTDDGYSSFSRGDYDVKWENDKVTICCYTACGIEKRNDQSTWLGRVTYVFA